MKMSLALTAVAVAIAPVSQAQTERDLDSHVHGLASMNIASTDTELFIELNSPWNNLVGFEHSPNTNEQKAAVDDALDKLSQPDLLFQITGGDCNIIEVAVDNSLMEEDHDDGHDDDHKDGHDDDHKDGHDDDHKDGHDDDHKDGHDDDHDDDHKDGHDDDHDDDHKDGDHEGHEEEGTHSAVLVTYSYQCKNSDNIETIDVELFSMWSGFLDLDVQFASNRGQALLELNPENTVINVERIK